MLVCVSESYAVCWMRIKRIREQLKFNLLCLSLADTDLESFERQCLIGTSTYVITYK